MTEENRVGEIAKRLSEDIKCTCDLDTWQPYEDTGHSQVCAIDVVARKLHQYCNYTFTKEKNEATSKLEDKITELETLLNTPELHDFSKAVVLEAAHQRTSAPAHQRDRWGPERRKKR